MDVNLGDRNKRPWADRRLRQQKCTRTGATCLPADADAHADNRSHRDELCDDFVAHERAGFYTLAKRVGCGGELDGRNQRAGGDKWDERGDDFTVWWNAVFPAHAGAVTGGRIRVEEKNNLGTTDDLELIAAINEGDEAAFEALYYRHRDWVVNLAHRWTEDRELAFDVLQETFFYFARKFPGFRLTGKLQTFLFPVVRNLSLTALRKSKRYRTGDEGNQLEEMPAAAQEAGGAEQLGAVVASLPVEQRDVLLLRFVDDLSLEEISETLGIPPGTVKSRLHNALEALRKSPRTKKYFGL